MTSVDSRSVLLHSAQVVTDRTVTADGWVFIQDGKIREIGRGGAWHAHAGANRTPTVDLAGAYLAPGFVDIHCHGAGGFAFDDGPGAAREAIAVHRQHGTTSSVLSFISDDVSAMAERLAWAAQMSEEDLSVLGSHAEGPFLAPGHKGAHAADLLTMPQRAAVDQLLEAAAGTLRQVTIASELPGGEGAITRFRENRVEVALGHTDASYEDARRAFDSGARILTHAFNAMNPIHHRAPGPVAAALERQDVILELICDGVHVHPSVMSLLFASAPGRIALITDAMSATCMPDGSYMLGSLPVTVAGGVAKLTSSGAIAGSTLTMAQAIARAVTEVGVPVAEAVYAATQAPLQAIGATRDRGRITPGQRGDLVVLGSDMAVQAVYVAGQRVR